MQQKRLILALLAGVATSGAAQAALHDRGGGLLYDDVLNITWLADANYAKTSGYDADGLMGWEDAKTWAANLGYGGYSDWRLPTIVDTGNLGCDWAYSGTDCGYNVQTVSGSMVYSEMAHMYYNNLGFKGGYSPAGTVQSDSGIFGDGTAGGERDGLGPNGAIVNLQSGTFYWSGQKYDEPPFDYFSWHFSYGEGRQYADLNTVSLYAWAVRPGDVAAVPEADTWAMLLAGLGLVGVAARRGRG